MSKKMPYMPLYGKDAWGDERFNALPWDVQGLFWRLAYWQWQEGSIPADPKAVGAAIGKPRETIRMWPKVCEFFKPTDDPARLANAYVSELRDEMAHRRDRQSDGARQTNKKRWGSPSDSLSDVRAIHTRVESESIRETSTKEPGDSKGGRNDRNKFGQLSADDVLKLGKVHQMPGGPRR